MCGPVMVFESAPLTGDLVVAGGLGLLTRFAFDGPDGHLAVVLDDRDPNGGTTRIGRGRRRLNDLVHMTACIPAITWTVPNPRPSWPAIPARPVRFQSTGREDRGRAKTKTCRTTVHSDVTGPDPVAIRQKRAGSAALDPGNQPQMRGRPAPRRLSGSAGQACSSEQSAREGPHE